jgi:predicted transposase/invertase (TIGR01784 family)
LQQAYHIAEQHTWTAEELEIYEAQGLKLGKAKNALETAFVDGRTEGKAEGEKAKAVTVAQKMLAGGFDVATIATMTDLTAAEIEALR